MVASCLNLSDFMFCSNGNCRALLFSHQKIKRWLHQRIDFTVQYQKKDFSYTGWGRLLQKFFFDWRDNCFRLKIWNTMTDLQKWNQRFVIKFTRNMQFLAVNLFRPRSPKAAIEWQSRAKNLSLKFEVNIKLFKFVVVVIPRQKNSMKDCGNPSMHKIFWTFRSIKASILQFFGIVM